MILLCFLTPLTRIPAHDDSPLVEDRQLVSHFGKSALIAFGVAVFLMLMMTIWMKDSTLFMNSTTDPSMANVTEYGLSEVIIEVGPDDLMTDLPRELLPDEEMDEESFSLEDFSEGW
jgi:hypothetical protein